jgi:hypothetical protein
MSRQVVGVRNIMSPLLSVRGLNSIFDLLIYDNGTNGLADYRNRSAVINLNYKKLQILLWKSGHFFFEKLFGLCPYVSFPPMIKLLQVRQEIITECL